MNKIYFCCIEMEQNIIETKSIFYHDVFDEYSILCREDNLSFLLLNYCPWCGRELPRSKREEWFDRLEKLGFEDPLFNDDIPMEFKTSRWRKNL